MTNQTPAKTEAPNNTSGQQSVFLPDLNLVKNYPTTMSDDEIDYDTHVNVRGNTPEDYHLNQEPNNVFQKAWAAVEPYLKTGMKFIKDVHTRPDGSIGGPTLKELFDQANIDEKAVKLSVQEPKKLDQAAKLTLGTADLTPEEVAKTYKPWGDILRESYPETAKATDKSLLKGNFAPWFIREYVPGELLSFGTNPANLAMGEALGAGAGAALKFGPALLTKVISKLPENKRAFFLKDLYKSEVGLVDDFAKLGVTPNSPTSEVIKAWKSKALETHPDRGGSADDFIAARKSFDTIMQTRQTWLNKIIDNFRTTTEGQAVVAKNKRPNLSLSSQSGSADLVPFSEGDLARMGGDIVKVSKVAGNIATVNLAGKQIETSLDKLKPYQQNQETLPPSDIPPTEPPQGLGDISPNNPPAEAAVNLERIQTTDEAKINLGKATQVIGDEIQNQTGKPLTHDEVIEKAKESEILTKGVSRESTLDFEAALLKTRQHLAALAEQPELTPEFLNTLKVVANTGTDIARQLGSFRINAMPEYATQKVNIIKKLQELGIESEKIIEEAKGVDFKDQQQVATFYRKFVKPKISEVLDEFAYMNILSSPKTHIVNAFSNAIQLAGLNPLTKLASGTIDMIGSALTGAERTHYVSEVPKFYKGAINAVPEAFSNAADALQGKTYVERPDIKHIPTLDKKLDYATLGLGKYVTRSLEASDVFFRTLIENGEMEALGERFGQNPTDKELVQMKAEAKKRAEYYVFRQKPDGKNKNGQGDLLSSIDQMTSAVYRLRDVPGAKWFIRFVQTPMNILKQGIEYSPAGVLTLKGAKDKSEQIGKTIVGSMVFAGASYMAMSGNSTWALPKSEKQRKLFYQAGRVPYSVKIGDRWISYSKLGPLAYPMAMASALHYYETDSPSALTDGKAEKYFGAIKGIMKFFSDQSYVQSLGDMLKVANGDNQGISRLISNIPTQLIPLSSLQGWVNQIIDPIYRNPAKGISVEAITDALKQKMVGMSQTIDPKKNIFGQEDKKEDALLNSVSPMQSTKSNVVAEQIYQIDNSGKQQKNKFKKQKEEAIKDALK